MSNPPQAPSLLVEAKYNANPLAEICGLNSAVGIESLTRREIEAARLAARGYTDAEIADDLGISDRTVESHLAHVYGKLGVTSRRVLIRMSVQLAPSQEIGARTRPGFWG